MGLRKLLLGAAATGLAAAALFQIPSASPFGTGGKAQAVPAVGMPNFTGVPRGPDESAFAAIVSRPLFGAGEKASAGIPVRSDLKLVGIVTDASTRLALVALGGGPAQRVRPGDTIGGWRIEAIDVLGVTATNGIRSARLVIARQQDRAATP